MVRMSSKRLALSGVAALLLAGGGWSWLQQASAASTSFPAANTALQCEGGKPKDFTVNDGPSLSTSTVGGVEGTFGKTTTTPDGRLTASIKIDDVYSQGYTEGVGDLTIAMDSSREAPPSSLTANQKGDAFPATQVMRFYPIMVLNNEAFRAEDPVEIVNSSVTSIPPKSGTTYVLTKSVTLRSAEGNKLTLTPGKAFIIK